MTNLFARDHHHLHRRCRLRHSRPLNYQNALTAATYYHGPERRFVRAHTHVCLLDFMRANTHRTTIKTTPQRRVVVGKGSGSGGAVKLPFSLSLTSRFYDTRARARLVATESFSAALRTVDVDQIIAASRFFQHHPCPCAHIVRGQRTPTRTRRVTYPGLMTGRVMCS